LRISLDVGEVGHRKGCLKAGRRTCVAFCSEVSGRNRKYIVSYYVPIISFSVESSVEQSKRWPTRRYISDGNW